MTERNTTESLKEFLGTFKRRMPKDVFIDMEAALSDIFPKLKESMDERIRKSLINLFKIENFNGYTTLNGIDVDDVITWLEKQGEQKETLCDKCKKEQLSHSCQDITALGRCYIEGMNKPKSNKVKPKFKIGDFIVNDYCMGKVIELTNDAYLLNTGQGIPFSCEHNVHLWDIQDAKDGDVLCYKDEVFLYKHDIKNCTLKETCFGGMVYYCCYDGKRFITNSMYSLTERDKDNIHPATKEQRDQLEKAMTDAGYTFDFEKKELRKIEQKPVWSEKDERILNSIIDDVRPLGEYPDYPSDEEREYFYEGYKKVDWLKSLKDRYTWKPSDEQMAALSSINVTGGVSYAGQGQELINLYNDLKKLMEE